MQIGVSVSIPASLSVRTTSSAASVPSTPSNLPPVGWVSRCEPRPTGGFDMSRPLRRPNIEPSASTCTSRPAASQRVAEPVAHLLVLGPERQPPHAAFRRGAEFRGFMNGVPQPGGIDLQVGGDFGHWAVPDIRRYARGIVFNDAPAAARQQRRRRAQGWRRDRPRARPRPYRGRPASLPKTSAEAVCRLVDSNCSRPSAMSFSTIAVGIDGDAETFDRHVDDGCERGAGVQAHRRQVGAVEQGAHHLVGLGPARKGDDRKFRQIVQGQLPACRGRARDWPENPRDNRTAPGC